MQPWKFVHLADIQFGSPRSFRFEPAWNENWYTAKEQILRIKPDLILIGGDLSADGWLHRFELEAIKAELDSLPFPYRAIPGNMDVGNKHTAQCGTLFAERDDPDLNLTSKQLQRYISIFGPMEWSFVHKSVRFSGFYAALAGSGLPEEKQMWLWLQNLQRLPKQKHHVLLMHYALFVDDISEPNYDITDPAQYHSWYFGMDEPHRGHILAALKAAGVDTVISGHIHCRKTDTVDGIWFYKAPATSFPQWAEHWLDGDPSLGFLEFDVGQRGICCTFIPLERLSNSVGYGPKGHPRPELRDYSVAWDSQRATFGE